MDARFGSEIPLLAPVAFPALEAIGDAITLSYGFTNAMWAIGVVSLVIFLTGLPISYYAARHGRGHGPAGTGRRVRLPWLHRHLADLRQLHLYLLRARGGHHGRRHSSCCSVCRRSIGYLLSAIVVIPLVTHGVTLLSRIQLWTQPLRLVLLILPYGLILWREPQRYTEFLSPTPPPRAPGRWRWLLMGGVRRRRHGGRRADRADRRTGGLPALHAAAHAGQPRASGGGVDCAPGRAGSSLVRPRWLAERFSPSSYCRRNCRSPTRWNRRRCTWQA